MPPRIAHRNCYIIAGPNGAGKMTFATELPPLYAKCRNLLTEVPRLVFKDKACQTAIYDAALCEELRRHFAA